MRTWVLLFCCVALRGWALDTAARLDGGPAAELLQKKTIRAQTSGAVEVNFVKAVEVMGQTNLLSLIQDEYQRSVAENGQAEFTIQKTGDKRYFYVNRDQERTDIEELFRGQTATNCFEMVLYTYGERSFGPFEALIHVQLQAETQGTTYLAAVYAYPKNSVSRFFARHLGLVERYFRRKTSHLTEIVTTISLALCNNEDPAMEGS